MNQYKKGQIVKGCVTGIENYGIFVSLDDYYSGLIHISEISDFFVKNPADYVHIGETIRARVVDDSALDSFHVRLSIKIWIIDLIDDIERLRFLKRVRDLLH